MPSFATLSIFATLAFSAFTSASPVASPNLDGTVAARGNSPASVTDALTTLHTNLVPLMGNLKAIPPGQVNAATVGPIIKKVTAQINGAVATVQGATAKPRDVVSRQASAPVGTVSQLASNIIILVVSTLAGLLQINADLAPILGQVSALLNTLILVLIPTVVDLVAAVDPLVQSTLNQVNYLVDALGLNGLLATLGL